MNFSRQLLLLAPLALGDFDSADAARPHAAPHESTQGSVVYVSGGIGIEGLEAMQAAAANYPLTLEIAIATAGPGRNRHIADVQIEIRDQRGNAVLHTTTDGPFLLVRLPSGTYTLDVECNDARKQRTVQVTADKRQHIVLEFPPCGECLGASPEAQMMGGPSPSAAVLRGHVDSI